MKNKNIILITYSPKAPSEIIGLSVNKNKVTSKSVWMHKVNSAELDSFIGKYSLSTHINVNHIDMQELCNIIAQKDFQNIRVNNIPQVDLHLLSRLFSANRQYDAFIKPINTIPELIKHQKNNFKKSLPAIEAE